MPRSRGSKRTRFREQPRPSRREPRTRRGELRSWGVRLVPARVSFVPARVRLVPVRVSFVHVGVSLVRLGVSLVRLGVRERPAGGGLVPIGMADRPARGSLGRAGVSLAELPLTSAMLARCPNRSSPSARASSSSAAASSARSVAYHLAHMGWKDVVLLERDRLTSGTTWHAAGLMVTFGSTSETSTEMRKYTRDLYGRLEAETGLVDRLQAGRLHRGRGRRRTASKSTAASPRSTATAASTCTRSRPTEVQGPLPAREDRRHPRRLLREGRRPREPGRRHDGAREGRPHAGRDDPRGGRRRPGFSSKRGAVTGVRTRARRHRGEYVVNCAGMWARQLGAKAGVNIPLQSAEHYYLITEKIPGLAALVARPRRPGVVRLLPRRGRRPDGRPLRAGLRAVEGRRRAGGLLVRRDPARLGPHGPVRREGDAPRAHLARDGREEVLLRPRELHAGSRSPSSASRPSSRTTSSRRASTRSASSPAAGSAASSRTGSSTAAPTSTSPASTSTASTPTRRTPSTAARAPSSRSAWSTSATTRPARCITARGAKKSALHDRLAANGRLLPRRERLGRGRLVRARRASSRDVETLSWGRQHWFPYWEAEHEATRGGRHPHGHVVHGEVPRAGARRRADPRTSSPPTTSTAPRGCITYTQWLNEGGTLEADLTVTKLDDERFWVVASDTAHRHVETWMRRHIAGRRARVRDRRHVGLRADQHPGAPLARADAVGDDGRPLERGVPVPRRAGDRHRLRARALRPHHLPGRARLRALRPDGAGDARRTTGSSRRARRSACATRG